MSIRTAAHHCPTELRFATLDLAGEIAYFQSASASTPGAVNVTALDLDTEETSCFCKGYECGHTCWHCDLAPAAWRLVAHRVRCEGMGTAALAAHGHSLAKHVLDAAAAGQVWIAANLRRQLHEAREVRQARRAAGAAPALIVLPVSTQRAHPLAA